MWCPVTGFDCLTCAGTCRHQAPLPLEPARQSGAFPARALPADGAASGACRHDFTGWRAFPDGSGRERVCRHCGTAALDWTLGRL